ncbi:MAG TPA: GNAT family N-acetyltransferase [Capsulimonadaceae bacterium]|nr:GNAT family N-acetyltransferase [Capsulimonadaceae bacterium]
MSQIFHSLEYKPIDLEKHADLCVEFAQEMHRLTFGCDASNYDTDPYIERIRQKIASDPTSCLFAWMAGEVVGQLNLGVFAPDPSIGYVNVFYVVPKWRGKGVAGEIERYACDRLRSAGFAEAQLSVAWANQRAVRFYEKHGWSDAGEREDRPGIHNMRKLL